MRGTNQTGKIKVTGGGILTALSLFPILVDIVELIYCLMTGQPIERIKKILINDIFTFIEGFIIGAVVAAIVAACGLTGGLAIIVTVVVCLLIGFIVSIFCPDGSITMTIINGIHKATSRTSYMQVMPAY